MKFWFSPLCAWMLFFYSQSINICHRSPSANGGLFQKNKDNQSQADRSWIAGGFQILEVLHFEVWDTSMWDHWCIPQVFSWNNCEKFPDHVKFGKCIFTTKTVIGTDCNFFCWYLVFGMYFLNFGSFEPVQKKPLHTKFCPPGTSERDRGSRVVLIFVQHGPPVFFPPGSVASGRFDIDQLFWQRVADLCINSSCNKNIFTLQKTPRNSPEIMFFVKSCSWERRHHPLESFEPFFFGSLSTNTDPINGSDEKVKHRLDNVGTSTGE